MKIDATSDPMQAVASEAARRADSQNRLRSWTSALERELLMQHSNSGDEDRKPDQGQARAATLNSAPVYEVPERSIESLVEPAAQTIRVDEKEATFRNEVGHAANSTWIGTSAVRMHACAEAALHQPLESLDAPEIVMPTSNAAGGSRYSAGIEPASLLTQAQPSWLTVVSSSMSISNESAPVARAEPVSKSAPRQLGEQLLSQPGRHALNVTRSAEGLQAWIRDAAHPLPTTEQLHETLFRLQSAFGPELVAVHWNASRRWSAAAPPVDPRSASAAEAQRHSASRLFTKEDDHGN